jgi:hypothetical protein
LKSIFRDKHRTFHTITSMNAKLYLGHQLNLDYQSN